MSHVIFFIEDDENINALIEATLSKNDFEVYGFLEPLEFFKKIKVKLPDLIVLDLMLPHINGFEVLRRLKNDKIYADIPVIILSAKSSELDIVQGLDMGASDYITKPFGLLEFISRINTNLRKISLHQNMVFNVRGLSLDIAKHLCKVKGVNIELTAKEFSIMQLLLENLGIVVTRQKLLKQIWGFDFMAETRTLDMHIKSLREKFAAVSSENYIETVRGIGFIVKE